MESSRNIYIIIMIFFLLRRWDVCTSGYQFNLFLHSLCVRKLPQCENNAKCILISCSPKRKYSYIHPALSPSCSNGNLQVNFPLLILTGDKTPAAQKHWTLRKTLFSFFQSTAKGERQKNIHIWTNWSKGSFLTRKAIPIRQYTVCKYPWCADICWLALMARPKSHINKANAVNLTLTNLELHRLPGLSSFRNTNCL